ncbi:hypothetical protein E2C01_093941 [Portunus trituberculatus]|uniref:Uncharacterized protein n=1 Tax=Portunus trituberculatus TaxID=210409 RepID=A0A5B7JZH1_PORTR|nr:hypothetical protein [Portunus trituberculatus]
MSIISVKLLSNSRAPSRPTPACISILTRHLTATDKSEEAAGTEITQSSLVSEDPPLHGDWLGRLLVGLVGGVMGGASHPSPAGRGPELLWEIK